MEQVKASVEDGSSSLQVHPAKPERDIDDDVKEFDNLLAKALARALQGSAELANMLPTGTVLLFQILDPILRRAGSCEDKLLSAGFLIFCSLVCFLTTFTDSFQAPNGKVYYGVATFKGLWTPQLKSLPPGIDFSQYKITVSDFVHAFLAVYVFFATTTFSTDVISCFVHIPEIFIRTAPSISGFLVSVVFLIFPTNRHGIGFPLVATSRAAASSSSSSSSV